MKTRLERFVSWTIAFLLILLLPGAAATVAQLIPGRQGGVFTTPWRGLDGSAASPTYSWVSEPDTGWFRADTPSTNSINLSIDGTAIFAIAPGGSVFIGSAGAIFFGSSAIASPDARLIREGAGHLFQTNATSAMRHSWANTYTSATNYESFSIDWQTASNVALVGTRTAATGTGRPLRLSAQATNAANVYASVDLTQAGLPFIRLEPLGTSALGAASTATAGTFVQIGGAATSTATSGTVLFSSVLPIYNQSASTAANTDFLVNRTETSVGTGTQNLIDAQVGGTSRWRLTNGGTQVGLTSGSGNVVYALGTTTTGDDPTEFMSQNRVATTDATVTTINTFTVGTSISTLIECRVVNRRTGGASGAAEDSAGYYVWVVVKNTAGTVAEIAAETLVVVGESVAGYTVSTAPSGATLLVQVTGAANTNITWHSTCRAYGVNA